MCMTSTNEMGSHTTNLTAFLRQMFQNCQSWGAILVINEADVLLEKRTSHSSHRNTMVNTFLRQLKSFSGTLLLKTTRIEVSGLFRVIGKPRTLTFLRQ